LPPLVAVFLLWDRERLPPLLAGFVVGAPEEDTSKRSPNLACSAAASRLRFSAWSFFFAPPTLLFFSY
jgi:hypothetical protein